MVGRAGRGNTIVIPIQNIYYMLAYAFQILREQGYRSIATESFHNTADLMAEILIRGTSVQIKRGLGRQYVTQTEELSTLRGKIDIAQSVKKQTMRNKKLICSYDEFSVNENMNQVIKSTLILLLKADIEKNRKKKIRKLLVYFSEVDVIDLKRVNWRMTYNRNNQTYQMLMSICYMIIRGLLHTNSEGDTKVMDFLDEQRMCRLYEKFILEYYRREFPQISASASEIFWQVDDGMNAMLPVMRTDIMLQYQEKVLIIDAKYYQGIMQNNFDRQTIHSGNLYQIFTYVKNKEHELKDNSEIFINDEFYEKQKDKWLHTGDMVMVQSGHVGHAAVIPEELDNTAAHALIMFRNPKEEIEPYFLNYEYQTDKAKKKIDNITTGNTIKHILASDMQEFVVDVPKSEEQKVIAGYFCNIDHLITLHQRKQSCIYLMCITKSWEQRKVTDLGEIYIGLVTTMTEHYTDKGHLLIRNSDIKDGYFEFGENPIYLDEEFSEQNKSRMHQLGDVITVHTGDIGTSAVIGENEVNSIGFATIVTRPNQEILDSNYFATYLNTDTHKQWAISMATGDGRSNYNLKDYTKLVVPIPEIEEQKKIATCIVNLNSLITLHQRKKNMYLKGYFRRKIMIGFDKEADFEQALITALQSNGWEKQVIQHPTEEQLIQNWADILFENNRDIDRLNDCPLVQEEMDELIEQIKRLRTPLALNSFINGKTVSITRKNPKDTLHYGKEVSLKIYDRMEIAAGQSRYQIVQQPLFPRHQKVLQDRRGDLMLLINGMPLFHIELKRSGIPVSEACNQIGKYAHEGVFTGLFSLIQVFVAMNPDETLYFANPGPDGKLNSDFFFHWADFNNEPINDWRKVASTILSIPMAHQLIGFYTVADDSDGILKVMRSYQYYAANKISDRVSKNDWTSGKQLGGYIWHTTGSGKTMTSFKSAQLIANSRDADKVVFLMDRIELGTQSLKEYRAFADNADDIQETEDTVALIGKLKSIDPKDTLIVSSIQKMSNIREDAASKMQAKDLLDMQSIRYYRMPHTMKRNIEDAVKLYSGDRPRGLFADHLPDNIEHMNQTFKEMFDLFQSAGIPELDRVPEDISAKAKFAKLFREFSTYLQAAQIQGFVWEKKTYERTVDDVENKETIEVLATENQYHILLLRYKELRGPGSENSGSGEVPFSIDPYLTEQNTGVIDYNYMNSRFEKWKKQLEQPDISQEALDATLEELHKSFAFLSQEEQKYANLFLHDVQTGDVKLQEGVTFQDYIYQYRNNVKNEQVHKLHRYFGIEEGLVYQMLDSNVTKDNLNEYGRFDALKATVVKEKAVDYYTKKEGKKVPLFRVNNRVNSLLTEFLLEGGKDIPDPSEGEN